MKEQVPQNTVTNINTLAAAPRFSWLGKTHRNLAITGEEDGFHSKGVRLRRPAKLDDSKKFRQPVSVIPRPFRAFPTLVPVLSRASHERIESTKITPWPSFHRFFVYIPCCSPAASIIRRISSRFGIRPCSILENTKLPSK